MAKKAFALCVFILLNCQGRSLEIQTDKSAVSKTENLVNVLIVTVAHMKEQLDMLNRNLQVQVEQLAVKDPFGCCNIPSRNKKKKMFVPTAPIKHVAFSSTLSQDVIYRSLQTHQVIMFDVDVFDFGNDYDNATGIFTAPVSGVYVFTWTTATVEDRNQETELVKSGIPYAYSYANGSGDDGRQVTNTAVLQVSAGEHVWIRSGLHNDGLKPYTRNTFSGWLLFKHE